VEIRPPDQLVVRLMRLRQSTATDNVEMCM